MPFDNGENNTFKNINFWKNYLADKTLLKKQVFGLSFSIEKKVLIFIGRNVGSVL